MNSNKDSLLKIYDLLFNDIINKYKKNEFEFLDNILIINNIDILYEIINEITNFNYMFNKNMTEFENFTYLIHEINKYLNNSKEKRYFKEHFNIKSIKNIDFINKIKLNTNEEEFFIIFLEIIIVMCTISERKDTYYEKIEGGSIKIINDFMQIVCKYMETNIKLDSIKESNRYIFTTINKEDNRIITKERAINSLILPKLSLELKEVKAKLGELLIKYDFEKDENIRLTLLNEKLNKELNDKLLRIEELHKIIVDCNAYILNIEKTFTDFITLFDCKCDIFTEDISNLSEFKNSLLSILNNSNQNNNNIIKKKRSEIYDEFIKTTQIKKEKQGNILTNIKVEISDEVEKNILKKKILNQQSIIENLNMIIKEKNNKLKKIYKNLIDQEKNNEDKIKKIYDDKDIIDEKIVFIEENYKNNIDALVSQYYELSLKYNFLKVYVEEKMKFNINIISDINLS